MQEGLRFHAFRYVGTSFYFCASHDKAFFLGRMKTVNDVMAVPGISWSSAFANASLLSSIGTLGQVSQASGIKYLHRSVSVCCRPWMDTASWRRLEMKISRFGKFTTKTRLADCSLFRSVHTQGFIMFNNAFAMRDPLEICSYTKKPQDVAVLSLPCTRYAQMQGKQDPPGTCYRLSKRHAEFGRVHI